MALNPIPYQSRPFETTGDQLRTALEVVFGGQDGEPGWLSGTAGLFNSKILFLAASRGLHYAHEGLRFGEWQPTTNHASPTQEQLAFVSRGSVEANKVPATMFLA